MILSQKATSFAHKILKHNPLPTTKLHAHEHTGHDHHTCSHHSQTQQIKPYLHVHDHRKERQIYQKPTKQKLECMRNFKEQGNQHFKAKRYQEAAHYYHKIIIFSDYTFPQEDRQQKQMEELVQQANCNLGMALLKLGEEKKAQENFAQGMKGPLTKIVIKSLYWLIKCEIQSCEFTKASENLSRLKSYGQSTFAQTQELQIQLKKGQEQYTNKSKTVFGNMFSKPVTGLN